MSLPDDARCWVADSFPIAATGSGVLDGTTVALKDLFSIAGHVPSFGHPRWRETHPAATETAPVVARLLDAGASIRGLAKMDQLAYSLVGNVGEGEAPRNTLHPDRFTGGSSSGSAAAVAAGLADVGIGTDTAGSVRVPAASCGLFGLRPTHGLVDSTGVVPLARSFDVVGVLTRDPALLGKTMEVLAGPFGGPRTGGEVGVPADLPAGTAPEVAEAVRGTARALARVLGGTVVERSLAAFVNMEVADLFARLQSREIWAEHAGWLTENEGFLAGDVRTRVERARALSSSPEAEKAADARARERYRTEFTEAAGDSVTVMPVMSGPPPRRDATAGELTLFRSGAFGYNAPSSLTGVPEIVIPVLHTASRTRLGVGLLGGHHRDGELIEAARALCPGGRVLEV
ncbi:amidohydrolase [Streptosporangium violaceochromogenes]|nr:amidohydrolase [Streptosporangium violaceochromogenes]